MDNNKIEKEIFINASIQTVWELVSRPAWWVGDAPGPEKVEVDGSRIVAATKYGEFPVLVEKEEPPTYLACRWGGGASSLPGEELREGNSTLVEFKLEEKDDGTVLRVVESGFAELAVSEDSRQDFLRENTEGWEHQLGELRKCAGR